MDAQDISTWYCCLNVREKTILRQTCEGLVLTLFVGVPKEIWDAFWIVTSPNGGALRAAFLSIYMLRIVTIGEGEDAYEAVAPADGSVSYWVDWSLFMVSPSAACLAGCEQSRVP